MKKIDALILDLLYRIANAAYRTLSIDNYTLGTLSFILAVCASTAIGVAMYRTNFHDTDPGMAAIRKPTAIFFPIVFAGLALFILWYRNDIRSLLSIRSDTEKGDDFGYTIAFALRWTLTCVFLLSLMLAIFGGMKWWSLWDLCFIAIGIWFYSANPPDMNLRMKKWIIMERSAS